jgi:hypothetical protein
MRPILLLLAAALAGPAAAADVVFDANYRSARDNAGTLEGAAFDRALGAAMEGSQRLRPATAACLEQHAGSRSNLHGYFQFAATGGYQVVLRPKSAFSDCMESALEGYELPKPPAFPWYNVFTFTDNGAP